MAIEKSERIKNKIKNPKWSNIYTLTAAVPRDSERSTVIIINALKF